MTGALSVAAADLRQRTRTFATLVLVAAALQLGYVTEEEFDRVVDPGKMLGPIAPHN